MAHDWNIRARGHVCGACNSPFADKKPCVSVLRSAQDGGYERLDYCTACWRAQTPPEGLISVWEGTYEAPVKVEKEEIVKRESAESLFRRLVVLEDPAMQSIVYVLAVMLERGKRLVERGKRPHESGGILRIYEEKATGDSFVVLDPRLKLDQIAKVQEDVVALLSGTHPTAPATGEPGESAPVADPPPLPQDGDV